MHSVVSKTFPLTTLAHNKWWLDNSKELLLLVLVVGSFLPWVSTTEVSCAAPHRVEFLHYDSIPAIRLETHLRWKYAGVSVSPAKLRALRGMCGVRAIPPDPPVCEWFSFVTTGKASGFLPAEINTNFSHPKCLCLNLHCCENWNNLKLSPGMSHYLGYTFGCWTAQLVGSWEHSDLLRMLFARFNIWNIFKWIQY